MNPQAAEFHPDTFKVDESRQFIASSDTANPSESSAPKKKKNVTKKKTNKVLKILQRGQSEDASLLNEKEAARDGVKDNGRSYSPVPSIQEALAKRNKKKDKMRSSSPIRGVDGFTCDICFEVVEHYAVGPCNHPICGLCSLRVRVKNKDRNCSICKQRNDIVIVASIHMQNQTGKNKSKNKTQKEKERKKKNDDKKEASKKKNDDKEEVNKEEDDSKEINREENNAKKDSSAPPFLLYQDFSSYINEDVSNITIEDVIPDMDMDPFSRMAFYKCKAYYHSLEKMHSNSCFVMKCKDRFPSQNTLLKHLKEKHNIFLCQLCVTNRSIFISEHPWMTKKEHDLHLKAKPLNSGNVGQSQKKVNQYTHPECIFCKKHFFDAQALYDHMNHNHHSCPLCYSSNNIYRFYSNIKSLNKHIHQNHLVCSECYSVDQTNLIAFSRQQEFENHLYETHRIKSVTLDMYLDKGRQFQALPRERDFSREENSVSLLTNNRDNISNNHMTATREGYVDLDMTAIDPNQNTRLSDEAYADIQQQLLLAEAYDIPDIPDNYQISGQIQGSGLYQSVNGNYVNQIQQLNGIAHQNYAEQVRRNNERIDLSSTETIEAHFPTFSSEKSTPNNNIPRNSKPLHSHSLVHQRLEREKKEREKKEREKKEMEEKKLLSLRRNEYLADSFGISSNTVHFLMAKILNNGVNPLDIRRNLFTPALLSWGNKNRLDLIKIERKLEEVLLDSTRNSIQLKPMSGVSRHVVHILALYYNFNSYEYDAEPNRYCSLVKTIDSCKPLVLLSSVLDQKFQFHEGLISENAPKLYFYLENGYYYKIDKNVEKGNNAETIGKKISPKEKKLKNFIPLLEKYESIWEDEVVGGVGASVSRVVAFISLIVENEGVSDRISVKQVGYAGATGVVLEFQSLEEAQLVRFLILKDYEEYKERYREAVNNYISVHSDRPSKHLLDLFQLETGFEISHHLGINEMEDGNNSSDEKDISFHENVKDEQLSSFAAADAKRKRELQIAKERKLLVVDWDSDSDSEENNIMMKISKEKPLPWPLLNQCLSATSLPESEGDENSLPPSNIFFRRRASGEESMVYKPLNLKPRTVPSENGGSNTSSAKDIPNSDSSSWRKKSISTATGYGLTKEERREKLALQRQKREELEEEERNKPKNNFALLDSSSSSDSEDDFGESDNKATSVWTVNNTISQLNDEDWNCEACTFLNSTDSYFCQMCESRRP